MIPRQLEPSVELLREEYVLVQAWKKTASYIRYHNWFSDTLALDRAAVNLPTFLSEIRERLHSSKSWQNDPLRIVPAPKSQRWTVREDVWEPVNRGVTSVPIRPLTHVSLADQVVATALMLCLADRVETIQGDPRRPVHDQQVGQQVISYGNRLFCDKMIWGVASSVGIRQALPCLLSGLPRVPLPTGSCGQVKSGNREKTCLRRPCGSSAILRPRAPRDACQSHRPRGCPPRQR